MIIDLTDQEHSTILAALRYYQQMGQGDPDNRSDMIHAIATDNPFETSMDAEEIDRFIEEKFNVSHEEPEEFPFGEFDDGRHWRGQPDEDDIVSGGEVADHWGEWDNPEVRDVE